MPLTFFCHLYSCEGTPVKDFLTYFPQKNDAMPEKKRRQIEREFGVPIAGEILEPSQWTQTALKQLPQTGPLDWEQLFGRQAPVVLDVGCGNGRFLLGSAVWRPERDHLGLDLLPVVIRYATRR